MIPAWLKGLAFAALLLVAAVDLGTPLVVRVQLDGAASDAAAAGGRAWIRNRDIRAAEEAARVEAAAAGATIERFELLPDGRIGLTLARQVDARLFDRLGQLDSWYAVQVDITSTGTTL